MHRLMSVLFLFLVAIRPGLCFPPSPSLHHSSHSNSALKAPSSSSSCNNGDPLGHCSPDDEFLMESEVDRRIILTGSSSLCAPTDHVGYCALNRNFVPCDTRGTSYYGCLESKPVNFYRRECGKITRCKRNPN